MKISLDWLCDYVDLPSHLSPPELAHELTLKTVEVEDVVDLGGILAGIVVARVETSSPVGGDALHLRCSAGTRRKVSAVTRARGVAPGAMIALALPGAELVRSGDAQPRSKVTAARIHGVASEGVVCSAADLGLERLFPDSRPDAALDMSILDATPGASLAEALGFDDTVFEIDNKSLTNRPDLWGHYGIAREFAAIFGPP
jgi:phenylalanyl-tRNA synthetase beta chain